MTSCCPTDKSVAASAGEYSPEGTSETIGAMDCYVVGAGDKIVVMIYDIFGFHPNNFELADNIASARGWKVVIPDLLRGSAWPAVNFPPKTPAQSGAFAAFLTGPADAKKRVLDVKVLIETIRAVEPEASFAVLGFCWGCKLAALCALAIPRLKAITGAHPAFLNEEDGRLVKLPTLWLPTGDDDMTEYQTGVLSGGNSQNVTVNENFRDMFHGFMAARGDWTNPKLREKASAGTQVIVGFLEKYF